LTWGLSLLCPYPAVASGDNDDGWRRHRAAVEVTGGYSQDVVIARGERKRGLPSPFLALGATAGVKLVPVISGAYYSDRGVGRTKHKSGDEKR